MSRVVVTGNFTPLQKFFLFLIVITSGTPLTQDYSYPNILLVLTFALLIIRKEIVLNKFSVNCGLLLFFLYLLWSIQFLLCPNNLAYSVILKYCLIIFSTIQFCTNTQSSAGEKIEYFVKIILHTSIISNILFLACALGVSVPTIDSGTHTIPSFYYLGAAAFTEVYGFLGYRNCGIFWEPGLYQIYLTFALIYFLYSKTPFIKSKWLIIGYLLFTVYTTGSTTGLFLSAFIVGYYTLFNSRVNFFYKVVIIIFVLGAAGGIIIPYLIENFTTKMDSASYVSRITDLTFGYEIFKEKPFLGYGIANDIYTARYSSKFGLERGDSNGLLNVLIHFGIVGFFVYARYLFLLAKSCDRFFDDRVLSLILIWAIVSLCTEPISTHATVFFLIGLGKRIVQNVSKEKMWNCRC